MSTLKLVNPELSVEIEFEKGSEAKDLLKKIGEVGHAGSIGLISLRSLLAGSIEECNGYVVVAVGADGSMDAEAPVAETVTEEAPAAEAPAAEEVPVAETSAEEPAETPAEAPAEAPAADTPAAEPAEEAPAAESAKEALKKQFGVNADAGGESLTPSTKKNNQTSRKRRDIAELINKAREGVNGELVKALEAAGFTIINVKNDDCRFYANLPGVGDSRKAPRFSISVLKSGNFTVSLCVDDRSTKLHATVEKDKGVAGVVACTQDPMFKDQVEAAVAAYQASTKE